MPAIQLTNVNKFFGHDAARVHVLSEINFTASAGKMVLILGPSGSGKSTLLTIAGGLQTPTSGTVTVAGKALTTMTKKQRDQLRLTQIGFILQAYNLVPYLTVAEQFALVDRVKRTGNLNSAQLTQLLADLGIAELQHKYPVELSGGQQQRVAIARALYPDPAIVLADEPTAALDSPRVVKVGQLLATLAREYHKAVIVVTHDLRLRDFADEIYHLEDGRLTKEEMPQ
ncbi:ABC transporter ATP-binding protein [Ligilactobacillus hohenheimensis]|uniref:ABC transporter ATP-binding protein n=1 Tax=Ligilactobacillus hohenheimensis TaxID=2991832 RepID=UPI0024BB9CF6|nr:ABC transporter ATP-binding protein [Ligilactobacillus hohenheimensis]